MGLLTKFIETTIPSGSTKDVHIYIDDSGNVSQIIDRSGYREKFYADRKPVQEEIFDACVIGVSDEESGTCSDGIAMGIGDNTMAYAIYE